MLEGSCVEVFLRGRGVKRGKTCRTLEYRSHIRPKIVQITYKVNSYDGVYLKNYSSACLLDGDYPIYQTTVSIAYDFGLSVS